MRRIIYCLLVSLLSAADCSAAPPEFNNKDFLLRLVPRTPSQIDAFYSKRGFPPAALAKLRKPCMIELQLHNRGGTKIWLNLGNWRFSTPQNNLSRIQWFDWQQRWQTLGLTQELQSTFRKTLAPAHLIFRPHQDINGYISLPQTSQPITITGDIYVGRQKNRLYTLRFENLYCAEN